MDLLIGLRMMPRLKEATSEYSPTQQYSKKQQAVDKWKVNVALVNEWLMYPITPAMWSKQRAEVVETAGLEVDKTLALLHSHCQLDVIQSSVRSSNTAKANSSHDAVPDLARRQLTKHLYRSGFTVRLFSEQKISVTFSGSILYKI